MAEHVHGRLLDELAPASVLVNAQHEILYFYGPIGRFLDIPAGQPTHDLTALVHEGLRARLRAALHKAQHREHSTAPVTLEGVRFERNGNQVSARLRIRPLASPGQDGLLLISFEEVANAVVDHRAGSQVDDETILRELEQELKHTREDLQSTIEELESANEELKVSNEEVMSINEELQSTNEELETSKEELQSLNEELSTVNDQLRDKVDELEQRTTTSTTCWPRPIRPRSSSTASFASNGSRRQRGD